MQKLGESFLLSASDLVGHLNCGALTAFDFAVAVNSLKAPRVWDPLLQILFERGTRHEQAFVEYLRSQGRSIKVVGGIGVDDEAIASTRAAMAAGTDIIVQGAFRSGDWVGRTDVLRRVETRSDLGNWSYEVIDAKLARETKGGTVLQLCMYADLLGAVQGVRPTSSHVVVPWSDYALQTYRMNDYAAYYRRVKAGLTAAVTSRVADAPYPEPKEHCRICRWEGHCDTQRRADDHLSLVAGITKVHIDELKRHGVETVTDLAKMPVPLQWKPVRGAKHSYERVAQQARIQVEGRAAGTVLHELLPVIPGAGLSMLPEPSPGDIFFDIEGDAFAGDGGLEYLFGYAFTDEAGDETFLSHWALSRETEKDAFERFIDFVMLRLEQYPQLHIYHFSPYEPTALKRLMSRYVSREEEIDFLLRSRCFVDLYSAVRNGLRASVESYSIKKLEPLYDFDRTTALSDANVALAKVQACLELANVPSIEDADRRVVAAYNRDDCISTWRLRDWLEAQRASLIEGGTVVARPAAPEGAPSETLKERQEKVARLVSQLTEDVPLDALARSPEQHARWLLAHMLNWHWREIKTVYWEKFRLCDLTADDLLDERSALSGLSFVSVVGGVRVPIHRYSFLPQETEIRVHESLYSVGGAKFGTVEAISLDERWVDIKKRKDTSDFHAEAVFSHTVVPTDELSASLFRIGEYVADHGMEQPGPYQAARDLLMRSPPRVGRHPIQRADETSLESALRLAKAIEGGVLPVQGPPGAGKTFTGARMICELVAAGKRVGVTAVSHKVIRKLLDEVIKAAAESEVDVRCLQRVREPQPDEPHLRFVTENADVFQGLRNEACVAGGTAWLWATPEAFEVIDVLFIDEAAQMSLANVTAVAQSATSIVLLGDPQQLEQPMKGSHPEGTDVSALHHILDGKQTVPPDRGLFLAETWRLHPDICAYTSELFYESRLHPRSGLENQSIRSRGRVNGTGLRYAAVLTNGKQSSSPQEADYVCDLVSEILGSETHWTDKAGQERPIQLNDILIIAPYNAQVFELKERLPNAVIGTVDKFQGQEAPIVIYSMTTSSFADAPRGMEFLYSLNRLNVATSRAKCLCVLVASPTVFEAQCRTPRQMQLANAYCRYLELATSL